MIRVHLRKSTAKFSINSLRRDLNHHCRSFNLVRTDKLQLLDLLDGALAIVKRDLPLTLPHSRLDSDTKEICLAGTHIECITLLVVSHAHNMLPGLQLARKG